MFIFLGAALCRYEGLILFYKTFNTKVSPASPHLMNPRLKPNLPLSEASWTELCQSLQVVQMWALCVCTATNYPAWVIGGGVEGSAYSGVTDARSQLSTRLHMGSAMALILYLWNNTETNTERCREAGPRSAVVTADICSCCTGKTKADGEVGMENVRKL